MKTTMVCRWSCVFSSVAVIIALLTGCSRDVPSSSVEDQAGVTKEGDQNVVTEEWEKSDAETVEETAEVGPGVWDDSVFIAMVNELCAESEIALNRDHPFVSTGAVVDIRLLNGFALKGTLQSTTTNHVVVALCGQKSVTTMVSNIDYNDRLRVDQNFRDAWIDVTSVTLARQTLIETGVAAPVVSNTTEDAAYALAVGDPDAQHAMGNAYLKGDETQKDLTFALLWFGAAASQGHTVSEYCLGRMYCSGLGIAQNKAEGLRWIAAAARKTYQPAEDFLSSYKSRAEQYANAIAEYERRQDEEMAARSARADAAAQKRVQSNTSASRSGQLQNKLGVIRRGPTAAEKARARGRNVYTSKDGLQYYYEHGRKVTIHSKKRD